MTTEADPMRTVDEYLELDVEIQALKERRQALAERMLASGANILPNTVFSHCVVVQRRPQYRFSGTVEILEQTIAGLQQRLMEQKQREIVRGKAEAVSQTLHCTVQKMTQRLRAALQRQSESALGWPEDIAAQLDPQRRADGNPGQAGETPGAPKKPRG